MDIMINFDKNNFHQWCHFSAVVMESLSSDCSCLNSDCNLSNIKNNYIERGLVSLSKSKHLKCVDQINYFLK